MDKKGIYLDQFWLSYLMVSFVFSYDPQKVQKSYLKMTYDLGMILETKTLHLGVKNLAIDLKLCTLVDD